MLVIFFDSVKNLVRTLTIFYVGLTIVHKRSSAHANKLSCKQYELHEITLYVAAKLHFPFQNWNENWYLMTYSLHYDVDAIQYNGSIIYTNNGTQWWSVFEHFDFYSNWGRSIHDEPYSVFLNILHLIELWGMSFTDYSEFPYLPITLAKSISLIISFTFQWCTFVSVNLWN